MNKLSLLIGATAMAATAFAGTPINIFFSTEGPDRYGDGALVEDGEVYALVWSADGATFGINADGSLVDPVNTKVISKIPAAKDGRCKLCMFTLDNGDQDLVGTFGVYLFDTRVVASDGTTEVAKKSESGDYAVVNSVQKVDANIVKQAKFVAVTTDAALTGEGSVLSALPADVPNPEIKDISVGADGEVVVKVGNTKPYVRYALSARETIGDKGVTLANGVTGSADGSDIELSVNNPKYKFFKAVRSN